MPSLQQGTHGDIIIDVFVTSGRSTTSTGGCAQFHVVTNSFGQIVGGSIELFEQTASGSTCDHPGTSVAHEIGHVLGLANTSCWNYIMSSGNPTTSILQPSECSQAADNYVTMFEGDPNESDPGGEGGTDGTTGDQCTSSEAECSTPIVVKRRNARYAFTAPGVVSFDLDADGLRERTAWTTADFDGGFLVLDRNGNGLIEDGSELFGARTDQPVTDSPNGFIALAVFDAIAAGGNNDGQISAQDAIFSELRIWKDQNQDGVSSTSELAPLAVYGVSAIDLSYREVGRRDRHSNRLRWFAMVRYSDQWRPGAVDVVFSTLD